ncbi:hypothetical protein Tco_0736389 [Tanacetum coccineum]
MLSLHLDGGRDIMILLNLKSKTTEDIISIGSFVEVLVLNQHVLVRKILGFCDGEDGDRDGELVALGETRGEALCDRGGEGGIRVLCLPKYRLWTFGVFSRSRKRSFEKKT